MSRGKIIWIASLALLYGAFLVWYGGSAKPVTAAEGERLLDAATAMYRTQGQEPPETDFRENMKAMIAQDDGREFFMINLETRKKGPLAAREEALYNAIILPLLLKNGGFPIYVGPRVGLALGQYGKGIDRVAVVRYRSLRDMLKMNADPAMAKGAKHKFAALAHTEVFISRPVINAVTIRLTLGLLFLMIGWLGIAITNQRWKKAVKSRDYLGWLRLKQSIRAIRQRC
ncbi:MAG: hypothetical protein ACRCS9_15625 [Hyphomicrobium sp.]